MRTQLVVMVSPQREKCSPPLEAVIKGGLAIHRALATDDTWRYRWTVSHAESGMSLLAGLPTPLDAYQLLNELLPLTDWTQDAAWIFIQVNRTLIEKIVEDYRDRVICADCSNEYL